MEDQSKLKLYIVSCHVDKPLTQPQPESKYTIPIQAGAALTDMRVCPINDMDDCDDNISERNTRYSEATAMYWIGKHISSDYVGILHYRRRLDLTDEQYEKLMDDGVDIITTEAIDLGESIENDYRNVLYSCDWDLFMEILKKRDPDDYDFAVECFNSNLIHACNINVFKSELYSEFAGWAFPILDDFYKNSPEKTDTYQHRDVGFIAERLSHLFVMKMERAGKKIVSAPLTDLRSDEWDVKKECDYSSADDIFSACDRLYKARQITKCCNVLGEAMRGDCRDDETIKKLSEIFIIGIKEKREEKLTMHEYLPEHFRTDLKTLLYVWTGFEKALETHLKVNTPESQKLLEDMIAMTGFGKTALREAAVHVRNV